MSREQRVQEFKRLLTERILVLDGAMGTMIQGYAPDEAAYRGQRFHDWPSDLKGNNDLLTLTQPALIREIHGRYLEAGADIIETNTFNSSAPAQGDYRMEGIVVELNRTAARLAREVADRYPHIPIVLTTGYSKVFESGPPFPVLRKPYQLAALGRVIHEALNSAEARRTVTAR